MSSVPSSEAVVLVPSADLDASIDFFCTVGFRLDLISPADDPALAVLSGHGITLRLERGASLPAPVIEIDSAAPDTAREVDGPDGVVVRLRPGPQPAALPETEPAYSITHSDDAAWNAGRAGLRYRDLIPDRHGGRFIASHISIPHGGPVADYVHHHDIAFQIIYCRSGTARLVYEDQGGPFDFGPGDCVLQPPHIRHRVLEASDGFEVIEVSGPADHPTLVDHELALPNLRYHRSRDFGGQKFVRHQADQSNWAPFVDGFEIDRTGIHAATNGFGDVVVIRACNGPGRLKFLHTGDLLLVVVLDGSAMLSCDTPGQEGSWPIEPASAADLRPGADYMVHAPTDNFLVLQVSVA